MHPRPLAERPSEDWIFCSAPFFDSFGSIFLSGGRIVTDRHHGKPEVAIALKASRVLEPRTGDVINNGVVVIRGNRIHSVTEAAPAEAQVIDLGNHTVLPGLIDCHTHMLLRPEDQVWPPAILFKTQACRMIEGVAAARTALEMGITTVRDTDNEGAWYCDVALRDAINRGIVPGPRMQVASDGITITAGDMTLQGVNPELDLPAMAGVADSPQQMIAQIRRQVKLGADWIKIYASSTRRDVDRKTMEPLHQMSLQDVQIVVQEARRWRRDVIAHAYGGDSARASILGGVRSIEHGPLFDDPIIALLVERGTFWVPTMATYHKRQFTDFDRELVRRHRRAFELGLKAGAKICFGTDVGSFPHGEQLDEIDLMVSYGMAPLDAIRSATTRAAELLRLDGQVGTLAPGAYADIIAVEGDPLADIGALKAARFVMKDGSVIRDSLGLNAPAKSAAPIPVG